MGERRIPSVRSLLQQAAAASSRSSDAYWALMEIYFDELHQIEEAVRLNAPQAGAAVASGLPAGPPTLAPEPARQSYAEGTGNRVVYRLLSESRRGPRLDTFVTTYYPEELHNDNLSAEVVADVQIAEDGRVTGLWLVSAEPEVFGNLATTAIRQWRFEAIPKKIRVVMEFR